MRGRWWWQKSGRPTGGARGGGGRAGTNKAQGATRLWADGDAPRELALPAEGTGRSGVPLAAPAGANEMWTMDYTHDELSSGRKFRTLNLMDGYTREALGIEVDTSLPGLRVVRV